MNSGSGQKVAGGTKQSDEEMGIRQEVDLVRLDQGMGGNRQEARDNVGDNTKVIVFMRDEFSEDILKEIEEEGISKTEVLQLLRDMEMTEENGEMGWDNEDETRQQGQDTSMKNVLEVLSTEIMPSHEGLSGMSQQEGGARYDIPNGPDQSRGIAEGKIERRSCEKEE
jgi:hypothetical protein